MSRLLKYLVIGSTVSFGLCLVVLSITAPAWAATADCNGMVDWNGDLLDPVYTRNATFCPLVSCDNTQFNCTLERSFPVPPSTEYHDTCYCPGLESSGTCSTNISSSTPGGAIIAVTCIPNGCTTPKSCKLKTVGPQKENGHYDVACKCE